jgi:plastocyanin
MGGMGGSGRFSRRLGGAALLLLVAGCGSAPAQISPDKVAPDPTVTPAACSLVPGNAVTAALAPPTAAEMPPASGAPLPVSSETPAPAPPPTYTVATVGTHTPVGRCSYASSSGPALVVSVFPHASLASLGDLTAGSTTLGPALVQTTGDAGLVTVQDGGAVVEMALDVGGMTPNAMTRRLAALATAVTNQPLPVPGQSSSSSTPTGTPSAAPTPAVAGQQVNGVTAAQTVQETSGLKFDPGSITVSSGGVVMWTNAGTAPHNVTFDSNPELTSGTMSPGDRYELRFTKAGQYSYHCTFHPGMEGTVTVS